RRSGESRGLSGCAGSRGGGTAWFLVSSSWVHTQHSRLESPVIGGGGHWIRGVNPTTSPPATWRSSRPCSVRRASRSTRGLVLGVFFMQYPPWVVVTVWNCSGAAADPGVAGEPGRWDRNRAAAVDLAKLVALQGAQDLALDTQLGFRGILHD